MTTVQERIEEALPLFQKYDSPISIATRMAQFVVESQAGTSELFKKSNNGFGIKVSAPWTGDFYPHLSGEVGGARVSDFRKYPNLEASIKDHAGFFESTTFRKSDEAYGLAIKATNYKDEARYLGPKFPGDKSSYAGDPLYAKKLIEVVERYNLTQYNKKENVKMPKVLLIAGHGLNKSNRFFDSGASGYVKKGEHSWYTEDVFPAMKRYLPKDAEVIFHTAYNVYSQRNIVSLAKSYGNDTIVVECHFDSGGASYSKPGGHVIIYKSFNPDALDLRLRDAIGKTVGLHPNYKDGISKRDNLQNVNLAANGGVNYRLIEWGMSSEPKNGKYMNDNVDTIAKEFVNALFGKVNTDIPVVTPSTPVDNQNPQGMKETAPLPYSPPRLPFDVLKVGDKATILSDKNKEGKHIWQWYMFSTKDSPHKMLTSAKQVELAGSSDVIDSVKDIPKIQNSERVYKLKNFNSWILEEYIVEARKSWDTEPPKDIPVTKDNYVKMDGKKYVIGDEIK